VGFGPADESSNLSRATICSRLVLHVKNEEKIVKALWALRELSAKSQHTYAKKLKMLNTLCDLDCPIETERFILSMKNASKYRSSLLMTYMHYCKANGIAWVPPHLKTSSAPICVPTEERIDKIISRASLKYVSIFQLSKHGLRPDEVSKITLRDIDMQRGLLTVRTSKLGAERTLKLKDYALENLRTYIQRKGFTQLNVKLFPNADRLRDSWNNYRKRAYLNFRDIELLKIRLYDLRHWFATKEYMRSRDLLHVKYLLGHRHIESTMVYVHLAQGLSASNSDDYSCKVAHNIDEASKLIESGFDYVTEFDGAKLFRIRK
jgi:integrase